MSYAESWPSEHSRNRQQFRNPQEN